ncbi:hypothetical protein [Streptomyces sp. NPDC008317]|uniref:hypothetical protein n=1 Tax=Streptomyces sp. NPDC008317 TaxID=3364827 RepID=UPI0036EC037E
MISELVSAVLLAYAAVEALLNDLIANLPDQATLDKVNAKGETVTLGKQDMARRLSTPEKLDRIIPLPTGKPGIKGTVYWERFQHLRRTRDGLVHLKESGYSNDPAQPSEYGRLLRGEARSCTLDAIAIVEKVGPAYLSDVARASLGIPLVSPQTSTVRNQVGDGRTEAHGA